MKKLIIIAFIVFFASMTKSYSQKIVFLPLNPHDTIIDKEYLPNYYNIQGDSYYIVDTMLYPYPKFKINNLYHNQIIPKDTCINKDLFIECEGKRMELEAKCLVAYQNCDIEKHNRKQADRFALFSWLVTGFVIINTIIYINNK